MSSILQKKKYERMLFSRPVILLMIILAVFLTRAVINVYEKAQDTGENLEAAQEELAVLEERGEVLEGKLDALGTPKGVEAEIRDKFSVVKEGESVILITDPKEDGNYGDYKRKKSLWERIKDIF